jgi:hypothetical protein
VDELKLILQLHNPFPVALKDVSKDIRQLIDVHKRFFVVFLSDERRQPVQRIEKEVRVNLVGQRIAAALQVFDLQLFDLLFLFPLLGIEVGDMSEECAYHPDDRKLEYQYAAEAVGFRATRHGDAGIYGICRGSSQEVADEPPLQQKMIHLPQVQLYQDKDEHGKKQIPEGEKPDMGDTLLAVEETQVPCKAGDVGVNNKYGANQTD